MDKKILIIEEHPVVTESLKQMVFNTDAGIESITIVTGNKELNFLNGQHFDIVILDIYLPDLSRLEYGLFNKSINPDQKILVIISVSQLSMIELLIRKGVNGIILKTSHLCEIKEAVQSVLDGNFFLGRKLKELMNGEIVKNSHKPALTKRENEILSLISDGLTNHGIADKLFISCSTVDSHRKSLLLKFNVNNTARLIKVAVSQGIIS
jgi:DNA-binding NarL/FixJ family response regulator